MKSMKIEFSFERFKHLILDVSIILFVILISTLLVSSDIEQKILSNFKGNEFIAYLLGGIFSVNFITAVPAYTFFHKIVTPDNFAMVLLGLALGSVIGDVVIFNFIKFRIVENVIKIFKTNPQVTKIIKTRKQYLKLILVFLGGLIIMSPFPDEIALLLMGFSRIKNLYFIPISFILNLLGNYIFLSIVVS
jgi:hypothetical protein